MVHILIRMVAEKGYNCDAVVSLPANTPMGHRQGAVQFAINQAQSMHGRVSVKKIIERTEG